MPPLPPGAERSQLTPEDWLAQAGQEIDPLKHAGEGWFSTDEYARTDDIENPFTRGDVGAEGEYYPRPDWPRGIRRMRGLPP